MFHVIVRDIQLEILKKKERKKIDLLCLSESCHNVVECILLRHFWARIDHGLHAKTFSSENSL